MSTNPTAQKVIQQAESNPGVRWAGGVAISTAILAGVAAIAGLLANRHTTEAMIDQIECSDQWSYYQAKGIKAAVLENKLEMLPVLGKTVDDEDRTKTQRYRTEQEEIKAVAEAKQTSATDHRRRAGIAANAATLSQIAIALAAISMLTKRVWFWIGSLAFGAAGLGILIYSVLAAGPNRF